MTDAVLGVEPLVHVERLGDGLVCVTLYRPDKRNSMNPASPSFATSSVTTTAASPS